MPTPASSELPPPSNWDEFEGICADVWGEIWQDRNTQRYGRSGQRQNGVDIIAVDSAGKRCAAQCKGKSNWPPSKLTVGEIDSEIEKAKKITPPLDEYFILTTAPNDVKVQDHVARLNGDKANGIDFLVVVHFWDEIKRRLTNYPYLLEKHYPGVFRTPVDPGIFDREAQDQLNRIVEARYFGGSDTGQSVQRLAENLYQGVLRDASSRTRMVCLAWCARLLTMSDSETALSILEKAQSLGECEEIEIANAFLTATNGDNSAALFALNCIDSPASRSASLIIQLNDAGSESALNWRGDAGYGWNDFDNDGKTRLLLAASQANDWALVESCLGMLSKINEPITPALASVAARASLQLAIPEEIRVSLDYTPPFFVSEFRISSTDRANDLRLEAIKLFQIAAQKLRAIGLDSSALIQEDFELWVRLSTPHSREDAKNDLRQQLKDKALRMRRANLALQFGVDIDRDGLIKELDQEIARSGGGNTDTGCTALAIALTSRSPDDALSEFRKRRGTIEQAFAKEHLLGIEIELLSRAEMGVEARYLLTENGDILEKKSLENLERIILTAEGDDPTVLLKEQYEKDGDLQTLSHLVDALFNSQAWEACYAYSEELFKRTENFADAKRFIRVLTETKRFAKVIVVLGEQPQFLDDFELTRAFSWSLFEVGNLNKCIEFTVRALNRKHDPELSGILTNAYIGKGDWEKLPNQIEEIWDKRDEVSAQVLLQTAHLAQITGHTRERQLVRAAVSKSDTDGFAFAGAYYLATRGGWEANDEVALWLRQAISLSGDDGPMYPADLREMVDKQTEWNKHARQTIDMLHSAQCPIFMAANGLNRRLIDFTLSRAEANRNEERSADILAIPSFSGKRHSVEIVTTRIGLEATSLMTLQGIGVLSDVFEHFDEIFIPHSTMGWLLEEVSEVRYHQPSRVDRAESLCQQILEGNVSVITSSHPTVTALEKEIGEDLAALVENANADRSKGNIAYVVRGFPITKAGTMGDESANLSGWDHLFLSTSSVVTYLQECGRISSTKASSALEYLALQETTWPEETTLKNENICYLDDLTISHLQHLELLESFCESHVEIVICEETHSNALALQKHRRHLLKVEEHLNDLRRSLNFGIASGKISILANDESGADSEDDRRLWSHPTMSVFGPSTAPEVIVVDDRFLNRHDSFERANTSSKIYSSLDILKTLRLHNKIDDEKYFNSLTALRARGHLFVPLELDELRYHISRAVIKEDSLIVGHALLQIKRYYLFARLSECLTKPDDVHWLLRSNRLINDIIREQWISYSNLQLAKAKSKWLHDLIDLRVWASTADNATQRDGVEGFWIANVIGLMTAPDSASLEERKAYLSWVSEEVIQPLKQKHSRLFTQIVNYSRDLMNRMLTTIGEPLPAGERKTAILAAVTLDHFPTAIQEALMIEENFSKKFGLPVSTIVTFLPEGFKFSAEDLFECAKNVFAGAQDIKISEAESEVVWSVCGVDQKRGAFVLCAGEKKIDIESYWPVQSTAEDRLNNLKTVASQVMLASDLVKYWSAKLSANSLTCTEVVELERDIENSLAAAASKIRHEINIGSSNFQTLVPIEPKFWHNAYPIRNEIPALSEFVENAIEPWIIEGQTNYGLRFCIGVLRCCIHSSIATLIDFEKLSRDDWLELADLTEKSGSMFSKLGFIEAVLAQPEPDPSLLDKTANIIDFILQEPETGRFELLSNLFFFVSSRLSLSSVFEDTPVFLRRFVEFSYASFLEEIFITERVDAKVAASDLAGRTARRAFIVGHLDALYEARWMPDFAMPHQLKAEFICRLNMAFAGKETIFMGTPLEDFIRVGSEKRISDMLDFPFSFLPGPLEGGAEQIAGLPDEWKRNIETELKRDPPSLGGFHGLVNSGAVFKLPADIISLSVAALRRVHLVVDKENDFSVGAFVDGLARVAAVCKNEQLADEIWRLTRRVIRRKPQSLEFEILFSLPIILSAAYEGKLRDQKLCEMIQFLSRSSLTDQQSAYLDVCLEDLLDLRPELWSQIGTASVQFKAQQY